MEFIAHRGAHDLFPENTLEAFRRAIELGYDAVELDVHATVDGVCVVHHDFAAMGPAGACSISETEYSVLREAAPSIPRLDEVLGLLAGHLHVYVEIKGRGIESQVAEVIQGSKAECSVHAFDHRVIARMRTFLPKLRYGILQESRLIDNGHALRAAGATDLWQWHEFIDQSLVDEVNAAGGRVICWTGNMPGQWAQFRDMGVSGLCTDLHPVRL